MDPDCDNASRTGDDTDSDAGDGSDSDVSSPGYCKRIGRYDPSSSSTAEALNEGSMANDFPTARS